MILYYSSRSIWKIRFTITQTPWSRDHHSKSVFANSHLPMWYDFLILRFVWVSSNRFTSFLPVVICERSDSIVHKSSSCRQSIQWTFPFIDTLDGVISMHYRETFTVTIAFSHFFFLIQTSVLSADVLLKISNWSTYIYLCVFDKNNSSLKFFCISF